VAEKSRFRWVCVTLLSEIKFRPSLQPTRVSVTGPVPSSLDLSSFLGLPGPVLIQRSVCPSVSVRALGGDSSSGTGAGRRQTMSLVHDAAPFRRFARAKTCASLRRALGLNESCPKIPPIHFCHDISFMRRNPRFMRRTPGGPKPMVFPTRGGIILSTAGACPTDDTQMASWSTTFRICGFGFLQIQERQI
jgi:hypothetical protein